MGMVSISISLSLPPLSPILIPKTHSSLKTHNSCLSIRSSLPFSTTKTIHFHNPPQEILLRTTQRNWRTYAVSGDEILPSEAIPVKTSQQITTTTGDEGSFTIISALLFIAFVGLSILTIGVIYIAVTDYLQKREREKFEKEEAAKKKKKSGKKGIRVRARAGPRGFGQKIEEDYYDDE